MNGDGPLTSLTDVIRAEQSDLPTPAAQMAEAIRARHGSAVRALVFYGSAMREGGDAGKMLDFYVIVRRYADIYPNPALRLATALLPPGVHQMQIITPEGQRLRSKYAVVSEDAFHRRAGGRVLESMLWARFVQPTVIDTQDIKLHAQIIDTFACACVHFHAQVRPLLGPDATAADVWARGLAESYRTELRPESPDARARQIVERAPDRYAEMSRIIERDETSPSSGSVLICRAKWALRRLQGKPRGAARVIKAAMTFDGGLDYILDKVADHSGVRLCVSDRARRHPILYAPVIAWRLYRAGAFR